MDNQIYSYHAEMCQVFSHPKRLELIDILRDKEMSVGELCQRLNIAMANLSQHLAMMKERHILLSRKEGNLVYYRIANPKIVRACDILREVLLDQIKGDAALIGGMV